MSWVCWAWVGVRTAVHILIICPRVPNLPGPKFAAFWWAVRVEEEKKSWNWWRQSKRMRKVGPLGSTLRSCSQSAGISDVCISLLSLKIFIGLIWKLNVWFISGSCHYRFRLLNNEHILYESYSSRNDVAWDSAFEICIISFRTGCIWGQPEISGISAELMRFKSIFYKQLDT